MSLIHNRDIKTVVLLKVCYKCIYVHTPVLLTHAVTFDDRHATSKAYSFISQLGKSLMNQTFSCSFDLFGSNNYCVMFPRRPWLEGGLIKIQWNLIFCHLSRVALASDCAGINFRERQKNSRNRLKSLYPRKLIPIKYFFFRNNRRA